MLPYDPRNFATNSNWTHAILKGTEIPNMALNKFCSVFNIIINNNWQKISGTDSLSHYSSRPSTLVSAVSPEATKEAAKKVAKTSYNLSPSSKPVGRSRCMSNQQSTTSHLSTKAPTFKMIIVPNNIHHGLQLPSALWLCLHFAGQGKTCTNEQYKCTNAHVTLSPGLMHLLFQYCL